MFNKNNKEQSKRNIISLENKIQILNRVRDGEKVSSVAKSFNFSVKTIRSIKRNENNIRKSVAEGYLHGENVTRVRDIDLVKMEKAVLVWFEDCLNKKIPLSGDVIKQKALQIYKDLQQTEHSSTEKPNTKKSFVASDGWLDSFKKRYNLYTPKLQGQQASTDTEAADKFKQELLDIIKKGGYCKDQIFNADETALYWKKLPSRTYISQNKSRAPCFKACNEHITLLICSNVARNNLLEPLIVLRSDCSQAMKNDDMLQLPIFWHNTTKAWLTADIFKQWFFNYFVPSVEKHMLKKNLSFKALLIVNNAACHIKDLNHPNIKIVFLPSNCTSLIQLLDQEIIHTFKAIYTRLLFKSILNKLEQDKNKALMEVWKEFSVKDCLNIISLTCKELKTSTLNACEKSLLPLMVKNGNAMPPANEEYSRIINVASRIDGEELSDINIQDVQELIKEESLDKEELVEFINQPTTSNMSINDNIESINNELSPNVIKKIIDSLKQAQLVISENDPSILRSVKFRRELQKLILSYEELLAEMKNDKTSIHAINNSDNLVQVQDDEVLVTTNNNNQHVTSNINDYPKILRKRKII